MSNQTPEQMARDRIDKMLENAGWAVQGFKDFDPSKARGIALREVHLESGFVDYALFVDREPVGVIEAKPKDEADRLSRHEAQREKYARSKVKGLDHEPFRFIYLSTGHKTIFMDTADPDPRSRQVYYFYRPETLADWLKQKEPLRARLHKFPPLYTEGLRHCQSRAIVNLEYSFKKNSPRALIQMATGSGKTYTAITAVYRLLKYAKAKRVLFLVDTKNLGEQAQQEFMAYTPVHENRKFTELYNVQRLGSSFANPDSQVCISTIQRMYSILRAEELDESAEEQNPNEYRTINGKPRIVEYNKKIPVEFFDFIIIDECHRSIYDIWKQVLEYFDATLIGLTATPDERTYNFFNENVVSEYTHEEAVTDGVNVGFDVYLIETDISKNGAVLKSGWYVEKRERLTRLKKIEQLGQDKPYAPNELDKSVVNKSQIRNIIKTFRDKKNEIFPGRDEIPKTLIFAKTDSHAEDIIEIVRVEFGKGDDFCKKITCRATNASASLNSFRNEHNPRIAVTVDMIAAGTDVKPLECLIFMRDVRASNYFTQMMGRGTRTMEHDDLRRVSPSANTGKTHFVIVDAVGVFGSVKTDMRPQMVNRYIPLENLTKTAAMGGTDQELLTRLAGRLSRMDRTFNQEQRETFQKLAGTTIKNVVRSLLDACDPDQIEMRAREQNELTESEIPSDHQLKAAQKSLAREATLVFTGELNSFITQARRIHHQYVDDRNLDRVILSGWDTQAKERAAAMVKDFKTYIREHRDESTALKIFYSIPYTGRRLTFDMVQELNKKILKDKPALAPFAVWRAYEQLEKVNGKAPEKELTALVSLVRRVVGIDERLTPMTTVVDRNFQDWVFKKHRGNAPKFNDEQMTWLRMIKDHIAASFHVDPEDLELAPFNAKGGLGKMDQLFGKQMNTIFDELNEELSA
jgi:type I restriction enzyme, R subunit